MKRALSLILALCMVLAMVPVTAQAAQPEQQLSGMMVPDTVGKLEAASVEPNAKSYAVTLTGEGNGEVELLVDSPAQAGSEVYFIANPDDGYLAEVYYEGLADDALVYVGADVIGFIMPANKVTLTVKFVAAEGDSHSVTVVDKGHGQYATSRNRAKEYESVLLAVQPDDASNFDPLTHVYVSDGILFYLFEEEGVYYYEIIMPDDFVIVVVAYEKVGPNSIVMNPYIEGGTVTINPEQAYFLDTVTVTIIPDPGYRLLRAVAYSYAGSFVSELTPIGGNKYTFTMHADSVDLDVIFEPILNSVTVKSGPGGTASANPTEAKVGDTVTITCRPDDNYRVYSVTGVKNIIDNGDNTYSFTMPEKAVTISVTYRKINNPVTVTVEANGIGGTASVDLTEAKLGDTVTLICTPDEGYRVAQITGVSYTDNGDGTYTFVMPARPVNISVLFLRNDNPFLDVNETHFFYDPVLWAVEKGITNGIDATHFGPFLSTNRAAVVTMLWRYAGCPEPETAEHPFTDVPAGIWYEKPVLWAVENGITNGISATEFGPALSCNRAQVVTFLWRAWNQPGTQTTEHPFTDVEAGSWYEAPVLWALENGVTTGATGTTFNPNGECLRAQFVTFLYRASKVAPAPKLYELHWVINGFQDTPSDYGTVTLSHETAAAGETITATVVPAEGYVIDWVKCEFGSEVTKVSETEYTFVMPEGEEIFHVNFVEAPEPEPTDPEPTDPEDPDPTEPEEPTEPVKTYTLDVHTNVNAKITYVDGKTAAAPGESIFFYVEPDPGYVLSGVSIFDPYGEIDLSKIQLYAHEDNLYEFVMIDHDIILNINFAPA